jgi:hypothetical protein
VFSKGCQHYRNNLTIDTKIETISVPAHTIMSVSEGEKIKFYVLLSLAKKKWSLLLYLTTLCYLHWLHRINSRALDVHRTAEWVNSTDSLDAAKKRKCHCWNRNPVFDRSAMHCAY